MDAWVLAFLKNGLTGQLVGLLRFTTIILEGAGCLNKDTAMTHQTEGEGDKGDGVTKQKPRE